MIPNAPFRPSDHPETSFSGSSSSAPSSVLSSSDSARSIHVWKPVKTKTYHPTNWLGKRQLTDQSSPRTRGELLISQTRCIVSQIDSWCTQALFVNYITQFQQQPTHRNSSKLSYIGSQFRLTRMSVPYRQPCKTKSSSQYRSLPSSL